MISRTRDAVYINFLVNHETIRPGVGPECLGCIDLSAAVNNDAHHFLTGEHGGFGLIWSAPHVYEVHTFILPDGRGRWALEAAQAGISYMFDLGAEKLWTRILPSNRQAKIFLKWAGMTAAGALDFDLGAGLETYELYEVNKCQQRQ